MHGQMGAVMGGRAATSEDPAGARSVVDGSPSIRRQGPSGLLVEGGQKGALLSHRKGGPASPQQEKGIPAQFGEWEPIRPVTGGQAASWLGKGSLLYCGRVAERPPCNAFDVF